MSFIRPVVQVLFLSLLVLWLSGCASLVADRILKQGSYSYDWFITSELLAEQGFEEGRYCSVQSALCLSYLQAGPQDEDAFAFKGVINGDPIEVSLTRAQAGQFRGTVVLLHGFGISKEYMAMTAGYFRFLGFNVIAPDLLGHGESDGHLGFGVQDSALLDELLNHLAPVEQPLVVFGNSMGAVAASYLGQLRDDVAGLILQAPMLPFDSATFRYVSYDSPLLARLVTEHSLRRGALKALEVVPLTLEQTDIRPLLTTMTIPVLILTSSADTVSPAKFFLELDNPQVKVADVGERSHYSMVVIDQADSEAIVPWLGSNLVCQTPTCPPPAAAHR